MERLAAFCEVEWDVALEADLPLSRHTLDSPDPEKWRRNAPELDPHFDRVREVAVRAHGVFASPPKIKPVARRATRPRRRPHPHPSRGTGVDRRARRADVRQRAHRGVPRAPGRARLVDPGVDVPERPRHRRALRRPRAEHALPAVPGADGHGRPTGRARRRDQGAGAALPEPARAELATRSARRARRLLRAPRLPPHRRHPHPRHGLRRRRALGGEHPVLLPVDVHRRLQLRAAMAASVRVRARGRGPLPSQRHGRRRRCAALRHRARHHRHRERLAREQDDRRRGARRPVG